MSVKTGDEVSAQVPTEDFQALEEKVYRTIELLKAAREGKAAAERDAARLREHHVQVPIPVDIGEGRTTPDERMEEVRAAFLRRDGEVTASADARARIPKQLGWLAVLLAVLDLADFLFEVAVGGEED